MKTRGRPRLYPESRRLTLLVEAATYEALESGLLAAYRRRNESPEASIQDLVRHLLDQAVRVHQRREAERSEEAVRKRVRQQREIKRLAAEMARTTDKRKLDDGAKRMAALVASAGGGEL